ncbi:protein O-mannosyl-transferase Tmtc3 [Anopheles aquasalis]|uniref:protein O-mannosyl-transferase Tmtc3 n=1 Tax=Anopheles aquasalis TaxID=42839 RepID=UPI00215AC08C|nr:protein O-mannosyl-transferase Tmtc3 [Anopheles aquasalis]XP_050093555.1 protein O-mannosyl-transferase Tmtc3 [Anopheles aquasalis]XP_050093556.1 protein O-mannosyl-transferase Tmtc3 [Anopheles aquasalis]XP_050093558.1 protein O-mannosyl-transferase Tmtc3 [Anopheles aquasalis]XP_050093559.1 protein O-mannosyl-transferase Tmtc3 [Anopheles aquasalis]
MASYHLYGALIALVCVLCYHNALNCGFVFDDISAIKENRDLRPHSSIKNVFLNDFWGTPMHKEQSHKSYRPLCVLTFRWNYLLHGLEPAGYHLVNVLLHTIVSLMYFRMCAMLLSEMASFAAALLFAVHPIHTEAVTGVVGRAETLSSVFFLAAFIFYTKATRRKKSTGWRYLVLSMLLVATAMLCKEQGITITGVCAIYEIFVAQKIRLGDIYHLARSMMSGKSLALPTGWWPHEASRRLVVLCVTTVALLFARLQIMGSQLPVFTRFDNPASVAVTPVRQLSYNYLVSVNLWLLLFPCDLCCDWTMGTVPLVESFTDPRNLSTLGAYTLIGVLAWVAFVENHRQKSAVVVMGLAFMILPFLPASNLFFPVGFVIAERVLYMPSMGFCLLVAYGVHRLSERWSRKATWCCLGLLLLTHSLKTYHRNADWESEYSIFMSGLKVNQRNAKLFNNVGHALESEGNFQEALQFFHKAVSVQEDDVGAHINVGRTYNHLKMFKEAEMAYLKAKSLLPKAKPGESYQARIAPNHLNVFLNLANLISKNATRLEEADLLYRQAISMRSDYTQAYINRGDILIKLNRTKEAQEVYERALLYDSANPDIYYNLGVVFLEQGKASQALAYLDKALEFDPEHEQALLNSAILLQELGRPELRKIARERLLKLLVKDEANERVHFNLGMLAMDDRNTDEAESWFRRAVHLKQDFRSALFNLALLLADDHRPLEAAPFLNQLVKYHPDHIKGLILLGDIYINNIKDLDAAENCYKRILQLDPINIQGLHNLCVVYVERGKLVQAQACLSHAHQLAPGEEYIGRHLQIVQTRINRLRQSPEASREKEIAFADYDPHEFGGTATAGATEASASGASAAHLLDDTIDFQLMKNTVNSNNNQPEEQQRADADNEANDGAPIASGGPASSSDNNMKTSLPHQHQHQQQQEQQQHQVPELNGAHQGDPVFIESEASATPSPMVNDPHPGGHGGSSSSGSGSISSSSSNDATVQRAQAATPEATMPHRHPAAVDPARTQETASTLRHGRDSNHPRQQHHHHHHHHQHHHRHHHPSSPAIGQDLDDPSSGMS